MQLHARSLFVWFILYWGPNGLPNGFWVMSYNPKPIVGSKQWTQNPFWVGLGWVGSGLEWVVPKSTYY